VAHFAQRGAQELFVRAGHIFILVADPQGFVAIDLIERLHACLDGILVAIQRLPCRNLELGLLSRDDLLLDEVQAFFDAIWRGQPCSGCKLRDECP
jgi:hypothetical protein